MTYRTLPEPPNFKLPEGVAGLYSKAPVESRVTAAMKGAPPGMPMAIVAQITAVRQAPGPEDEYAHTIFLSDCGRGRPIQMAPTTDLDLVDEAESLLLKGGRVVAYGHFVADEGKKNNPNVSQRFELVALRSQLRRTELLGATPAERTQVREHLNCLIATEQEGCVSPIEMFLAKELTDLNYLVGCADDHRFERILRLLMLQALSDGQMTPGANPRLSIAMASHPGQGKGILARCAMMMAPATAEVQPSLVTPVGLGVRMEQMKGQGYTVTPGALAKASLGLGVVHDAHRIESKYTGQFQAILMNVIEDGVLKSTKASDMPYEASCAVLMNGNLRHMVEGTPAPKGPRARLQDLCLPLDLFSRFDVVLWVGIDKKLDEVARKLASQSVPELTKEEQDDRLRRIRQVQLMIAELRDSIPSVNLETIASEVEEAVDKIAFVLREKQVFLEGSAATLLPPEALIVRMSRTLRKLLAASARLYGRDYAVKQDLEIALDIMGFKMEVVHWACTDEPEIYGMGSLLWQYKMSEADCEDRRIFLMQRFAEKEEGVTVEEIARVLRSNVESVERDLNALGAQKLNESEGRYKIPTRYEYEQYLEGQERKAEEAARQAKQAEAAAAAAAAETQQEGTNQQEPENASAHTSATPPPPPPLILAYVDKPLPGRAHKFVDSLPKLPVDLRAALPAFPELDWFSRERVRTILLDLALGPKHPVLAECFVNDICQELRSLGAPIPSATYSILFDRLLEDDWEERARFALSLYSSLWTFCGSSSLELALERATDLPTKIRRHAESALRRCDFAERHGDQAIRL